MIQKFSGKADDSEFVDEPSPVPAPANVELRRRDRSGRKAACDCTAPREGYCRDSIVNVVGRVRITFVPNTASRCTAPIAPVSLEAHTIHA